MDYMDHQIFHLASALNVSSGTQKFSKLFFKMCWHILINTQSTLKSHFVFSAFHRFYINKTIEHIHDFTHLQTPIRIKKKIFLLWFLHSQWILLEPPRNGVEN